MTKVKFPRTKVDGNFCVEVVLDSTQIFDLVSCTTVQIWISNVWMPNNRIWIRDWSDGTRQELRFEDDFVTGPMVIKTDRREVVLRLEGKGAAKFWKDWMVSRILPAIKAKFPEVGEFRQIRDCAGN